MSKSTLQLLPADELSHPDARWLRAYTASKATGGDMLSAGAVLPQETRGVAAHLMVLEPTETSEELRYVSVGDAITRRFGLDLTGKTLQLASLGGWAPAMGEALASHHAVGLRGEIMGGQSSWARLEALILPIAYPGSRFGILAGLFFV